MLGKLLRWLFTPHSGSVDVEKDQSLHGDDGNLEKSGWQHEDDYEGDEEDTYLSDWDDEDLEEESNLAIPPPYLGSTSGLDEELNDEVFMEGQVDDVDSLPERWEDWVGWDEREEDESYQWSEGEENEY